MRVFRKQKSIGGSYTCRELALWAAEEFFGRDSQVLNAEFFKDPYGILTTGDEGKDVYLIFFFKDAKHFDAHFAKILQGYLACRKNWNVMAQNYPSIRSAKEGDIQVLIFMPVESGVSSEVLDLVSIPLHVMAYTALVSGGEEAILLEEDGDVETEGIEHAPSVLRSPYATSEKESTEVLREQPKMDLERPSGLSFFQRAKLDREEIRALLDLELRVDEIKNSI